MISSCRMTATLHELRIFSHWQYLLSARAQIKDGINNAKRNR